MGYSITKKTRKGEKIYEWSVFFSAYGAAGGDAKTLAEAKVRMAIAQADILEQPFPKEVERVMLEDPERFAKEYPDEPEWLD